MEGSLKFNLKNCFSTLSFRRVSKYRDTTAFDKFYFSCLTHSSQSPFLPCSLCHVSIVLPCHYRCFSREIYNDTRKCEKQLLLFVLKTKTLGKRTWGT